jgi:hypothetical protein
MLYDTPLQDQAGYITSTIADIALTVKGAMDATDATEVLYPNPIDDAIVDTAGEVGKAAAFIYENWSSIVDDAGMIIQGASSQSMWMSYSDPMGDGLGFDGGGFGPSGGSGQASFGSGGDDASSDAESGAGGGSAGGGSGEFGIDVGGGGDFGGE